jgi:hypothetical protein
MNRLMTEYLYCLSYYYHNSDKFENGIIIVENKPGTIFSFIF